MLRVNIQNFRNIRSLDLSDDGKLTVIVGYNESGKSSFIGAIKFAFTGEAFGHKGKDLDTLITHGESRFSTRVQVNDLLVNRTSYGTGDPVSSIAQRLDISALVFPVMFDSQMAGDGGNKAMRAYLTGTAGDQFDPSVHFAEDKSIKDCADLAKRSGKLQVKAIVAFCEAQRAMHQKPSKPVVPPSARPTETQIQQLATAIETCASTLAQAKADRDSAISISHDLSQVANYIRAMEQYQTRLATTKFDDPLGSERQSLERLSGCNPQTLSAIAVQLQTAGYTDEAKLLSSFQVQIATIVTSVRERLAANPVPPSAPVRPAEPAIFADYRNSLEAGGQPLATVLPAVLSQATTAVQVSSDRYTAIETDRTTKQQQYDAMQRALGAWQTYDGTSQEYDTAAQRAEVEWARWDTAAKQIQLAHTDFLTEQSTRFSNIVSQMGAAVLGGRKLSVDVTNGITLGGLPIEDVSVSTRWRMEICVMTAIAASLKSPLLLIDGADVLDVKNRRLLTEFITEFVVPHFKHVVLTMTAKDDINLETKLDSPIASRWIMNNGTVTRL